MGRALGVELLRSILLGIFRALASTRYLDQEKPLIVLPSAVCPATGETCGLPADRPYSPDHDGTIRAAIGMLPRHGTAGQRQFVATLFVHEAEVDTRLAPFRAMGGNPSASGAMMRKKMREFVAESPIDLAVAEFFQPGIKHHQCPGRIGVACGAPHLRIPAHLHTAGQIRITGGTQQLPRGFLERRADGWGRRRERWLKSCPELREEVELLAVHRLPG